MKNEGGNVNDPYRSLVLEAPGTEAESRRRRGIVRKRYGRHVANAIEANLKF